MKAGLYGDRGGVRNRECGNVREGIGFSLIGTSGLHCLGFGAKQCVEVELGALLIDSLHTLAHTELGKATPILQLKHPFLKFVNVK